MKLVALVAALSSAGCALVGEDAEVESDVIGGRPETGYSPVGYLASTAYPQYKTICGATLIAPTVAVTAAHCVDDVAVTTLSVGFGTVGSSAAVKVSAVHTHPSYVYRQAGDYLPWADVAVLELAQAVTNIVPATIARAEIGDCTNRYVGYGRTTPGDGYITTGYDGERKSAQICADAENVQEIYIHGHDGGGLCWGDSGGALLVEGTTRITGVLSRHAPRPNSYSCEAGNRMIFSSLAAHRELIAQWAPEAFEPEPAPGAAVGWCNVQWPQSTTARPFSASEAIYGRVWIDRVTPDAGQGAGVRAEVGYAPAGTSDAARWIWYAAHYNVDADGPNPGDRSNDEYAGTVFPYATGTYDLAYRFSTDHARTWTTCSGGALSVQ